MGPLKPHVGDLVVAFLAFFVVFGILSKVLLPRISRVLVQRFDAIEGGFERAEAVSREAAEVHSSYQHELAEARHEAARLRQEALEQGAALLAEIRAEGHREREAVVAAGRLEIETNRALAEAVLREEVASLATELASRIVGESVSDLARRSDVIDRFFEDLDTQEGARGVKS
jgi:F-type H+-transporting ATPase subunit b